MIKVNGALLLYHHYLKMNAATIMEHVDSFCKYAPIHVWKINTEMGFPKNLKNYQFRWIIFHYSLFALPIHLKKRFQEYIVQCSESYKIAFFQDEHRYWPQRSEFINRFKIDCVYTLLEEPYFAETYRKHTTVSKLVYNLPGYVSEKMVAMADKMVVPESNRTIDIGYRGRKLPFYMGRGSQEKHSIGHIFKKKASGLGLNLDIETDEAKRIYGDKWYQFLASCKAVLGVEAGVSVFDIDNVVRPQYALLTSGNPDAGFPSCSFEEVYENILAQHEDKIYYRTISPRHFEAAAFRICQILFEGKYSGILKPMVHYIPLKKDFSNFDDVIRMFKDEKFRKELTENAYNDLIGSEKYHYKIFVNRFYENLMDENRLSKQNQDNEAVMNDSETEILSKLNSDVIYRSSVRYVVNLFHIMNSLQFPGRCIIRFFLRPFFMPLITYIRNRRKKEYGYMAD